MQTSSHSLDVPEHPPRRPAHVAHHRQHERLQHLSQCVSSAGAADDDPADVRQPVCLVVGAGAGVGQAVARKFAREGLCVCAVRRGAGQFMWGVAKSDVEVDGGTADPAASKVRDDFNAFIEDIRSDGGRAEAFFADGSSPDQLAQLIGSIERQVGPIACAVYNIGAQIGVHSLNATSYADFQNALSYGAVGAFALAKEVTPYMLRRGRGCLIFTSSTAAFRGNAGQHAHTAAMGARRNLCQSLNAELAAGGVHICHVNIDGTVDAPESIGKIVPEFYAELKAQGNDGLLQPDDVANTYWHLYSQPRTAWTLELDLRPFSEKAWFNS
eukprot:COSAG02_NODE_160_length_32694_cov_18.496947_24_plen_327_part_00